MRAAFPVVGGKLWPACVYPPLPLEGTVENKGLLSVLTMCGSQTNSGQWGARPSRDLVPCPCRPVGCLAGLVLPPLPPSQTLTVQTVLSSCCVFRGGVEGGHQKRRFSNRRKCKHINSLY